jgi:hypothetical protein
MKVAIGLHLVFLNVCSNQLREEEKCVLKIHSEVHFKCITKVYASNLHLLSIFEMQVSL